MGDVRIIRKVLTIANGDIVAIGIDPSLNGSAIAVLVNGVVQKVQGWTDKVTVQKSYPEFIHWFKLPAKSGFSERQYRVQVMTEWIVQQVGTHLSSGAQVYVSIEGYAHSKRSIRLSDIHELCGIVKQSMWSMGAPFRIYDPKTLKMAWATGNADKHEMMKACADLFGYDYRALGENPGSNLADAFLLAQLLWVEIQVKLGMVSISELTPNLQKILTRTTPASPQSLLNIPFISKQTLVGLENPVRSAILGSDI